MKLTKIKDKYSRLSKRILSSSSNSTIPYGSLFGHVELPYGDDVSFGPIKLNEGLILKNTSYHGIYISINGFVSFEQNDLFEEKNITQISKPEIAVLLNDFDTKRSGSIYYKEIIDKETLGLITTILNSDLMNSIQGSINITSALVVTWANVPLYGLENMNTKNTFQLILATEANCSSYSIFYYSQIDLGTLTNFTIGITSGEDGLFIRNIERIEFLNSIKNETKLPLKYSFRLSDLDICFKETTTTSTSTTTRVLKMYNESCSLISDDCNIQKGLSCQFLNGWNKCL